MNPLDWSGPPFLAFYVVALIVAHFAGKVLGVLCRSSLEVGLVPDLGPYDAARLAGGSARAIDCALVRLLRQQSIRVADDGEGFETSRPLPSPANDLPAELYRDIAKHQANKPRTLEDLHARRCAALAPIEARLRETRLLPGPGDGETICRRVMASVPVLLVIALGTAKIVIGLARNRPVLFLVILLLVSIVILFVKAVATPAQTRLGERELKELQRRNAALQVTTRHRAGELADADLLMAVALFGPGVLAAGELAWMHQALTPRAAASSDSGSSSGGSCGSSGCGGGGGGCGGCGG